MTSTGLNNDFCRPCDGIFEYRATAKEMKDFPSLMEKLFELGFHHKGCIKIIPDKLFRPGLLPFKVDQKRMQSLGTKQASAKTITHLIPIDVGQGVTRVVTCEIENKPPLSLHQYYDLPLLRSTKDAKNKFVLDEALAGDKLNDGRTKIVDGEEVALTLEEYDDWFWEHIHDRVVPYATECVGTLLQKDYKRGVVVPLDFFLAKADPDGLDDTFDSSVFNRTFPIFGKEGAFFTWHVEPCEETAVNYLVSGAPKTWYSIPLSGACAFEDALRADFPDEFKDCRQFMKHRQVLTNPDWLKRHNIPYHVIHQQAGELVVCFPYGYHQRHQT